MNMPMGRALNASRTYCQKLGRIGAGDDSDE
jgi:hypothetical protein